MEDCLVQNVLYKFGTFCNNFGLYLNTDKCKIITFPRTRKCLSLISTYNSRSLLRVYQVKDLGFIFVPSFDFHLHLDFTTSKALRVFGSVRKHYTNFDNPKRLSTLYNVV